MLHLNTKQDIVEQRQNDAPDRSPAIEIDFKARLRDITQESRKVEERNEVDTGFVRRR